MNDILRDRIRLDLLTELTEALAVMEQNPDTFRVTTWSRSPTPR